MNRWFWTLMTGGCIALASLSVACGDDDDNVNPTDGGPGADVVNPDADVDGGCTFATYVIGLINTQTTNSAQPDTTLGAGCKDSTSQDEFKSLFP